MPRDRANIRIDLWADEDWRRLSVNAQHLYILLLSHSTLSYAGVADWRPKRLAPLTADRTPESLEEAAEELKNAAFIYPDDDTEEVLIRSFVRHDGVIRHPKLHVSMANDFASIASARIREFVAFELQKLHQEDHELALWKHPKVQTILKAKASDMKVFCLDPSPAQAPALTAISPSQGLEKARDLNSDPMPTATATATSPKGDMGAASKTPETRLSERWNPSQAHATRAQDLGLDLASEAESFKLHAQAHDRRAANWNAAFTMWLKKSAEYGRPSSKPRTTAEGRVLAPGEEPWMNMSRRKVG